MRRISKNKKKGPEIVVYLVCRDPLLPQDKYFNHSFQANNGLKAC